VVVQRPVENAQPKQDKIDQEKIQKPEPKLVLQPLLMPEIQQAIAEINELFKGERKNLEMTVLRQPIALEGNTLTFMLQGDLQMEIFQKAKPELLGLLRSKLHNEQLIIESKEVEEEHAGRKPLYTSTDKLNHLKQKSPALAELQRRFGLETDF
jgi:hypothetical protein